MRALLLGAVILGFAGPAVAEGPVAGNLYSVKPLAFPVAEVKTAFKAKAGQAVRVTIYDSEDRFLEEPRAKREGHLDANGVAIVPLHDLEPGEYALAAYLDENDDGKLNRGKIFGIPKEPVAFSNGVVPKLRKPKFDETKVNVSADSVVSITLED